MVAGILLGAIAWMIGGLIPASATGGTLDIDNATTTNLNFANATGTNLSLSNHLNGPGIAQTFTFGENVSNGEAVYMSDGTPSGGGPKFQVNTNGTLTSSLISYYKLSNTTDFWSTNNLTNNGASFSPSGGPVNGYADGGSGNSSNYLDFLGSMSVGSGAYSINCWVNLDSAISTFTQDKQYVIAAVDGSNNVYGINLLNSSNGHQYLRGFRNVVGSGSFINYQDVVISPGTWYMTTYIYDGTTQSIWFNGTDENSNTDTTTPNSGGNAGVAFMHETPLVSLDNKYLPGKVAECGFWNKALSSQEVSDLYNGGAGQTMVGTPGNGTVGRVYAASAADYVYSRGFIGFADATTTAGNIGPVTISGLATNVSTNMSIGKQYYLGDNSGTLSLSPGTVSRKVGIAVATNTLEITNEW